MSLPADGRSRLLGLLSAECAPISVRRPRRSDVIISPRTVSAAEGAAQITAWGATRADWLYSRSADDVALFRTAGARGVGGAVNASWPSGTAGQCIDIEGNPVEIPWLPGTCWACTLHPAVVDSLTARLQAIAATGCDAVQTDDPQFQLAAAPYGGDFNPQTLQAFAAYLGDPAIDYKAELIGAGITTRSAYTSAYAAGTLPRFIDWRRFLRKSVSNWFAAAKRIAPSLMCSQNVYGLMPRDTHVPELRDGIMDYVMAEMDTSVSFTRVAISARTAEAFGCPTAFVVIPPNPAVDATLTKTRLRQQIAMCYALGGNPIVPYDTYMGAYTPDPGRFFGTTADYGDLYAFVRAYPKLFDGFENIPSIGIACQMDSYLADNGAAQSFAGALMNNCVPFCVTVCGGDPVISADRARDAALVAVCKAHSDGVYGAELPTGNNVMHYSALSAAGKSAHSFAIPSAVVSTTYLLPRFDLSGLRAAIHIVNTAISGSAQAAAASITIALQPILGALASLRSARLFTPSGESTCATARRSDGMMTITVPAMSDVWGIVLLEFSA